MLPDGQDPDDFIRANGSDGYTSRGKALPFLQFVLNSSMTDRSIHNPRQKSDAIENVLPVLAAIRNPVQKRQSFDDAMAFYRVDDSNIKRELWRTVKSDQRAEPAEFKRQVKRVTQAKITVAEQHLLELLVYDGELQDKVLPILEETDFENLASAQLFRALFANHEKGLEFSQENVRSHIEDDEFLQDFVPLLMMTEPKRVSGEVIDEVFHQAENCIFSLRSMAISNRIFEISQELIAAEQSGNAGSLQQLVTEQLDLARMKQDLLSKIRDI